MKLSEEQRSAIRNALGLAGLANKDAADMIGLARSAFSDALRKNGKRSFPDAQLEVLLTRLQSDLSAESDWATRSERAYRDLIREELSSIVNQAKRATPGAPPFPWVRAGLPMPKEARQCIETAAIQSAQTIVDHLDRFHCFAGPKMGKSTLGEIFSSLARSRGYPVVYVRRATGASTLPGCLAALFAAITDDRATADAIAACEEMQASQLFRQRFSLWFKNHLVEPVVDPGAATDLPGTRHGRGSPQRGLVIIEDLDGFIGPEFSLDLFLRLGMTVKNLSDSLRSTLCLITFSAPFASPDVVNADMSSALMSSGFNTLTPVQLFEIVTYLRNIGLDPRQIDSGALADMCGGNWFAFQILGYFLRHNYTEQRASELLTRLYENPMEVAGEDADLINLGRHIEDHKRSAQLAIVRFASTYDPKALDSARTVLSDLFAGKADAHNTMVRFLRRCGLVNQEGRMADYARSIVAQALASLQEA